MHGAVLEPVDRPVDQLLERPRPAEVAGLELAAQLRHVDVRHDRPCEDALRGPRQRAGQAIIDALAEALVGKERGDRRRDSICHGTIRSAGDRSGERLVEVRKNVIDVLDADAEAQRLRTDAREPLLLRRHLPVRGRGRVAGE